MGAAQVNRSRQVRLTVPPMVGRHRYGWPSVAVGDAGRAFVGALAADPLAWGLVGFGVSGMLLYTHALQHGQVGPVTAVLWIVEVIAPSVIGVAVLHDAVRDGWAPYAVVAVLATASATAAATRP